MSLEITVETLSKKSNPRRVNTHDAGPPLVEIVSPRTRKNGTMRRLTAAEMQRYKEALKRAGHASEEIRGEQSLEIENYINGAG